MPLLAIELGDEIEGLHRLSGELRVCDLALLNAQDVWIMALLQRLQLVRPSTDTVDVEGDDFKQGERLLGRVGRQQRSKRREGGENGVSARQGQPRECSHRPEMLVNILFTGHFLIRFYDNPSSPPTAHFLASRYRQRPGGKVRKRPKADIGPLKLNSSSPTDSGRSPQPRRLRRLAATAHGRGAKHPLPSKLPVGDVAPAPVRVPAAYPDFDWSNSEQIRFADRPWSCRRRPARQVDWQRCRRRIGGDRRRRSPARSIRARPTRPVVPFPRLLSVAARRPRP